MWSVSKGPADTVFFLCKLLQAQRPPRGHALLHPLLPLKLSQQLRPPAAAPARTNDDLTLESRCGIPLANHLLDMAPVSVPALRSGLTGRTVQAEGLGLYGVGLYGMYVCTPS